MKLRVSTQLVSRRFDNRGPDVCIHSDKNVEWDDIRMLIRKAFADVVSTAQDI